MSEGREGGNKGGKRSRKRMRGHERGERREEKEGIREEGDLGRKCFVNYDCQVSVQTCKIKTIKKQHVFVTLVYTYVMWKSLLIYRNTNTVLFTCTTSIRIGIWLMLSAYNQTY